MDSDTSTAIRQRLLALGDRLELDIADRESRARAGASTYERARADGLCHEGAWECALDVMACLVVEAQSW
jgi:hypothetical protein